MFKHEKGWQVPYPPGSTYLPTPYDDGDNHLWFVWGIMITVGGWQYDDDFNRTVNLRSSRLDFAFLFVSSPEITQFLD